MRQGLGKTIAVSLSIMALLALGVVLKLMAGVFTQITIALFAMFLVEPSVARATSVIDRILRKISVVRRGRSAADIKKSRLAEVMGSVIVILLSLALVAFAILILYAAGNMLLDRRADLVTNVIEPVVLFINGVQNQWLPEMYRSVGIEEALQAIPSGSMPVKPWPADSQATSPMAIFDDAIGSTGTNQFLNYTLSLRISFFPLLIYPNPSPDRF
ncbi:MAG: hypothetical protein R6V62_11190, partial [Candidatus Fermentibacteraceae bacterium]